MRAERPFCLPKAARLFPQRRAAFSLKSLPGSGYIFFGETDYFAWMPAVPEGLVEAQVTAAGKTERFTRTGYHDHNWGNIAMFRLMHHWYWGRAKVGEYQVISSYITA